MFHHTRGTFRRSALTAALLSLGAPGLGHLYAGRVARGVTLWTSSNAALPLGLLASGGGTRPAAILLGLLGLLALSVGAAWDAARAARRSGDAFALRGCNRSTVYAAGLLLGVLLPVASALHIRDTACQVYYVPTSAMAPALVPGDRFLAVKSEGALARLRRGDVVVFASPDVGDETWVKRVVGLPGDTVAIRRGVVLLDGRPLARRPAGDGTVREVLPDGTSYRIHPGEDDMAPLVVPGGQLFVLGDRRPASKDSRHVGPIPHADVEGRADLLVIPANSWSRFGPLR